VQLLLRRRRCGPEWWRVKLLMVILRGLLRLGTCALLSRCTLEEVAVIIFVWELWTARTFWHDSHSWCSSPFCQTRASVGVSA
jgi:hypothetical protein